MQNHHIKKVMIMMKITPPTTPPAMAGVEEAFFASDWPGNVPALTHLADAQASQDTDCRRQVSSLAQDGQVGVSAGH